MIRFNNDYNHGAFASILKELGATNSTSYAGYGELCRDRCCIIFGAKRDRCRYRTYQLSRGGVHREHRTQDSGTSEYRWQDYRAADRRLRQGVLRSGRAGVSDRAEDGISVFPDRRKLRRSMMCAQNMGCIFSWMARAWDMDLDRRKMILL